MNLPNFLIIGAAKSGTTALYRYMKQHPEIYLSDRKEPHFFSFTDQTKLTNGPDDYVRKAITNFDEYQGLFNNVRGEKAIGEASPTYIYIPGTAERILSIIPDVKIIAILRNPADRAFSAYMHLVRDGIETSNNFQEALKKENERIANNWGPIWHFINSGFYFKQLSKYYEIFDKSQIKIVIYDDFDRSPQTELKSIYKFLDINDQFEANTNSRPNVSGIPKNRIYQSVVDYFFLNNNPIRSLSRILFSEETRWRVTTNFRNLNLRKNQIPENIKKQLLAIFKNDIIQLEKLIDKDLSCWQ